jgi:hypothetical protein
MVVKKFMYYWNVKDIWSLHRSLGIGSESPCAIAHNVFARADSGTDARQGCDMWCRRTPALLNCETGDISCDLVRLGWWESQILVGLCETWNMWLDFLSRLGLRYERGSTWSEEAPVVHRTAAPINRQRESSQPTEPSTRGKSKNPRPKDKFGLTQETTTEPINWQKVNSSTLDSEHNYYHRTTPDVDSANQTAVSLRSRRSCCDGLLISVIIILTDKLFAAPSALSPR